MEFYVVVLIFITCMIVLALLIYYCQEYRSNAKYSFTENQRDISAIALAIAAPAFNTTSRYQPSSYQSPGIVSLMLPPQSSQPQAESPGFVINGTQPEKLNVPPYPIKSPPPTQPLQGYSRPTLIPEDEMSDSGSSSSSKIYFSPNTAAYSIAKRMSVTANADYIAKRRSLQAAIPAQAAAYLLAKRMKEIQPIENPNSENNHIRSMSPVVSEDASKSDRGNFQEPCSIDMKNRRSMSPYIPTTVSAFHLRNRSSRSKSPYTPLQRDSPSFLVENEKSRNNDKMFIPSESNNNGISPIPPKRIKKQNSLKQNDNDCSEQKEMAPPQRSENICYPKQSPVLIKKVNEDRIPFVSTDGSYRSSSPAPLHTVEEEE
ncbi:hypothetical protein ILUMI_03253 [Ignelater luminosus]|uniref:Uncharacterized protein n=1 Tax=Ignelater luminosus TaxID=2038154 RepID=A0A8K0DG49_IGNLU|nr:hypothetical protein ILUMI_03253 [Ignelater luminosus]